VTAIKLKRIMQRLRVPLGFVLVPIFLIFAEPTWTSMLVGAGLAVLGISIRAWASGHLRKMAELTTSGPYAHTRNPLYFGTFLMVAGAAIAAGTWWLVALVVGLFLLVYVPVMLAEVDTMRALFPDQYDQWAAEVPLFLPRPVPWRASDRKNQFDPRLYLRYREYRAAIGVAGVLAVLVAKLMFKG
jgi:protein-S-isoprenylcysteine O-methyltransferase Ste14